MKNKDITITLIIARAVLLLTLIVLAILLLSGNRFTGARGSEEDLPPKAYDGLFETGSMPDNTSLEFWITENVEGIDFSGHDEITGWFGAREYLGSDYRKIIDSNGADAKPKHYVSYLVSAYPDYADGGEFITRIEITDPEVNVCGLNVSSTAAEFNSVFEGLGFMLSDGDSSAGTIRIAEKDGISFTLIHDQNMAPKLVIRAEITNREGIQY